MAPTCILRLESPRCDYICTNIHVYVHTTKCTYTISSPPGPLSFAKTTHEDVRRFLMWVSSWHAIPPFLTGASWEAKKGLPPKQVWKVFSQTLQVPKIQVRFHYVHWKLEIADDHEALVAWLFAGGCLWWLRLPGTKKIRETNVVGIHRHAVIQRFGHGFSRVSIFKRIDSMIQWLFSRISYEFPWFSTLSAPWPNLDLGASSLIGFSPTVDWFRSHGYLALAAFPFLGIFLVSTWHCTARLYACGDPFREILGKFSEVLFGLFWSSPFAASFSCFFLCKTEARWVESRQVVFHKDTTAIQVLRHAILSSPRDQSIPGEFGSAVGRSWYLDNALWASNACEHQLQTSLYIENFRGSKRWLCQADPKFICGEFHRGRLTC